MRDQNPYNVTENEFVKGIAEGKYTPNDVVAYCRGCFDKEQFLKNLFASECAFVDFPMERQRAFISRAKEAVYRYLIKEGYKLPQNYGCWDSEETNKMLRNIKEKVYRHLLNIGDEVAINREWDSEGDSVSNPDGKVEIILPSEFDTDRGRKYFSRAVKGGLLTNEYKPAPNVKKPRLAIFASELGKRLNIRNFNSLCEQLWGLKHLSQAYQRVSAQKNFDALEKEIKLYFITEK